MAFAKGVSFADAFEGERSCDEILLDYLMDLCVITHDRMEELGINQQDLARKMGKKESQVSRMLSGEANITLKTLAQIDEALGLGIELHRKSADDVSGNDYANMTHAETTRQSDSKAKMAIVTDGPFGGMMAA